MIRDTENAKISQKQDGYNIYAIMKTKCPPGYHHNGFVATHALGDMMYGYTLLVPMNQRVLNKPSQEHNISSRKWSRTQRMLKSHKSKMGIIYMQSWKQNVLLVITTMALWQLMYLRQWCTVTHCWYQWTKDCSTSQARSIIYVVITTALLYTYIYVYSMYIYIYR